MRFFGLVGFIAIAFATASGEWVCLRSLEVGHLVHGVNGTPGTGEVWFAIVSLAASIAFVVLLRIVFVDAWAWRRSPDADVEREGRT
jgi:hypothetical protein